MPIGVAGAIAAGGSVLSAGIGALSSSSASKSAASAANNAANLNESQFNQTLDNQNPYIRAGYTALPQLTYLASRGTTGDDTNYLDLAAAHVPPSMTQAEVEQTPGYQFNLSQGLKATQSAAAARGLGVSGAALKGAATYATGLADSTYQNQFANKQTIFGDYLNLNTTEQGNLTNMFNRLNTVANLGENAATSTGAQGTTAANNAGNFLNAGGQATAAGTVGAGNAASSGINNFLAYQAFNNATKGGGTTTGYSAPTTPAPSFDPNLYGYAG